MSKKRLIAWFLVGAFLSLGLWEETFIGALIILVMPVITYIFYQYGKDTKHSSIVRMALAIFVVISMFLVGMITINNPKYAAIIAESRRERAERAPAVTQNRPLREREANTKTFPSCEECLHINQDTFGCASKTTFDRVITYIAQGDRQVATTAVSLECTILSKGTPVHTESYEFLSGVAQIRPQGSSQSLWVMSQTISK